ncbi:DUF1876 domain-containing protein [Streptomyces mobaraensis NBRC 13819 = DSM 40847]|uniref:DUF1876 domain-containing protein n=1 Tax=Streptomyces mobaraensis (strain ATCC 29032 / DSM 40847 / JCM 4168 / NBRC 13819 / NCIMB 11159 / IPCR 16-22) TaxID=1223523 RepID=M3B6I8_STRM1|nr:DUF1876 domain-containing protein [Streptomyces mobaraensis]EMF01618.1 hypothetical protein H340_05404 [Streptomyces mobaraensis NBRC 13819 = DSM 40847]QTT74998.1 DUF1876 domain-containing protein [Streptomyces mobaraensis NBRC 13819 = DSM 40847]
MSGTKSWTVNISISEHDHVVTAEARLSGKPPGPMVGEGTARCHPADENVPDIGDELAASRALHVLADQLLDIAVKDIERHTHERVRGIEP